MNSNKISHIYCKNVQEVHIELQNVQKVLYCSRTAAPTPSKLKKGKFSGFFLFIFSGKR